MKIISESLTLNELSQVAVGGFGNMVKAVVDIDKAIIAIDAELHSDLEAMLSDNGSKQIDLWGINLYPDLQGDDFIEFDSMINMRPAQGNRSRGVENEAIRKKIVEVVMKRIKR